MFESFSGPTLASGFMCHIEKFWLENCPTQFKPLVYRGYMATHFIYDTVQQNMQKSFKNVLTSKATQKHCFCI